MNARRGAANKLKMTNIEFRSMKKEVKDSVVAKDASTVTSDYFKLFDTIESQYVHDKHKYYLNMAAKAATKSDMNHKHGAIIVYKKKIVAIGCNYYKGEYSIHAEIDAISQLKGKEKSVLPESELYVVRIGPEKLSDHLKYSKPCYNCQNYILKKCIKRTYYSTNYNYDTIISKYLTELVEKTEES